MMNFSIINSSEKINPNNKQKIWLVVFLITFFQPGLFLHKFAQIPKYYDKQNWNNLEKKKKVGKIDVLN